jgi:cytochrome d ubiquinol oxidase subunit I
VLSLIAFYGIYLVLGIVAGFLMLRYARRGLQLEPDEPEESPDETTGPRAPALTY